MLDMPEEPIMRNRQHIQQVLDEIELGIPKSYVDLWDGSLGTNWANAEPIWLLRIVVVGPDNHDPKHYSKWPGRWWVITKEDTEAQVRNTVLKAVLTYMEYEHRERLLVAGEPIYESNH